MTPFDTANGGILRLLPASTQNEFQVGRNEALKQSSSPFPASRW
jgi:hypothetical protein